jgi:hypothetical protein
VTGGGNLVWFGVLRVTGDGAGDRWSCEMPIIPIKPIEIKVSNGHTAIINGIDPASTDTLVGYVPLVGGEQPEISWDLNGRARGHETSFNLRLDQVDEAVFGELKDTALHLMLPYVKEKL